MEYPSILKRVQSTFVDQILTFTLIGLFITLANMIDEESVPLKIVVCILAICYEPFMTYAYRTVGQIMTGLRVVENPDYGRPSLYQLFARYVVKIFLGWVSLIIITFNQKRRAIHDISSGTLVVLERELREEREKE